MTFTVPEYQDIHIRNLTQILCHGVKKNVQPDRDSNLEPSAYWANALPTELPAAYTSSTLIVTKSESLHNGRGFRNSN